MNPIRAAIQQPVTVAVGVILIVLAGVVSVTRLPVALTPTVDATVITVTTIWEGASPEEVEQNVIDKQEERLLGLSNLRLMTSASGQGQGTIRLEFNTGTEKEVALREVSDKLREVPDYPENVDEPVIDATDSENRDYIAWIVFGTTDPDFDVRVLRDFAVDRIEPALERVPGISEVNVLGGRERELQIRVDPVRVAQYGITPTELARVIRDTNQNVSAGQVARGKRDVRVRTLGQYGDLDDVRRTVVRKTDAGAVELQDLGEVLMTYKEPTSFVRSKGRSVIAINADREPGSNVVSVMKGYRAAIEELNAPGGLLETEARRLGLDGTLYLEQVYDQTVYIDDAIALVTSNIWIGGGLAIFVLILFLRSVRSVAIIAMAIPISVVGAIVAMVAMGRSINVISLAGMAFAVGMVVDNAIVVLENIYRHLEMGKRPPRAALDGAKEVWGAVLAATLTTVAVFIPILLVQEEAGQLFRDIALAICAAVTLSLIVSITVIPTLAARMLKPIDPKRTERDGRAGGWIRWVLGLPGRVPAMIGGLVYRLCGSIIGRVAIITLLTGISVAGTFLLMPPSDYLPAGNRNLIFGLIIPPPGYNIDHSTEMAGRIEETIEPYWEAGELVGDEAAYERAKSNLPQVPTFDWMAQAPGNPIVPPPLENYFLVSFEGTLFHGGVSTEPRRVADVMPLFSHATRSEVIPGTIAFPFQMPLFRLGGTTGSALKLQLSGPDLDEIVSVAEALFMELGQRYGFQSVQPDPANFAIPGPEVQVLPDLVRLGQLGLSTADVGLAVQAAGDGAIIDEYELAGETIDLKVIAIDAASTGELTDLEGLPIATPSGHVVPLSSIAEIREARAPQQIARVGRQRSVSFQITPPEGTALEALISEIETLIADWRDQGRLPPTIATSLAGSASKLQNVQRALLGGGTIIGTLGSSLSLALIVVYLLMCVLFQSFLRPLVIMFSVPLATLGGFVALFGVFLWSLSDRTMPIQMLDVLTMLGFVILIGVVVNNAILIVHQALNFMRGVADDAEGHHEPMQPREAIAASVRSRVRPILMGTLTSVGGMAPLVLMPGSGSELYRGLGSVVVGGLLMSTVFTILLVPLLFSLVTDLQMKLGGVPELREDRGNVLDAPARPAGAPAAAAMRSPS